MKQEKSLNFVDKRSFGQFVGGGTRNSWLDFLKGIAIVAVVFYHMGILDYGYLGVDLFLVVNGYLITKSILKSYYRGKFSYFSFLVKRIIRLWPLALLAAVVSLVVGYFNMLPDDLENLGESVVASNLFANNILSSITAKNYWDTSQAYKPLMHTWYLGIIVQFYIVYPIIVAITHKISKSFLKSLFCVLTVLSILSLICYLCAGSIEVQFYYLQCRFFEMALGGLICIAECSGLIRGKTKKFSTLGVWICLLCLVGFFIIDSDLISSGLKLLLVVGVSCASVLFSINLQTDEYGKIIFYKIVVTLGICSYSIYIWHQVVLAFYRYIYNASPSIIENIFCLLIIAAVSAASYLCVEKNLVGLSQKKMITIISSCVALLMVTSVCGLVLYMNAGVVRDIPELSIYTNDVHRGMHAEYNDRVYNMDVPFDDTDTIKVLVVGNSFARDWVNILLESDISDQLNISYIYAANLSEDDIDRIAEADYVFVVAEGVITSEFPDYLYDSMKSSAYLYGIGTKQYGTTNGNLYSKRNQDDYYSLTVSFSEVSEEYEKERDFFGEFYIDFIAPILHDDGSISAFTDDNKYISQDCRHLTQSGAQFYARIFDLKHIFNIAD